MPPRIETEGESGRRIFIPKAAAYFFVFNAGKDGFEKLVAFERVGGGVIDFKHVDG